MFDMNDIKYVKTLFVMSEIKRMISEQDSNPPIGMGFSKNYFFMKILNDYKIKKEDIYLTIIHKEI